MELRKCKECGKMFQPKGREQYCSDTHYRPCPICGEPVIARYLSDPPRKCDKCRGKRNVESKPAIDVKLSDSIKPASPTGPTVKPMQIMSLSSNKSIFKINPMTIPGTKQEQKPKPEIVDNKSKASEVIQSLVSMSGLEDVPIKVDSKIFCASMSGSRCRFIRKEPLCGWIPGHEYMINVDHDVAAYIISSSKDESEEKQLAGNGIALRCASQTSFFNYFRKVKEVTD